MSKEIKCYFSAAVDCNTMAKHFYASSDGEFSFALCNLCVQYVSRFSENQKCSKEKYINIKIVRDLLK